MRNHTTVKISAVSLAVAPSIAAESLLPAYVGDYAGNIGGMTGQKTRVGAESMLQNFLYSAGVLVVLAMTSPLLVIFAESLT